MRSTFSIFKMNPSKDFVKLVNQIKPYSYCTNSVIVLFNHESKNQFERFLADSRVRPLILMHLLFNFLKMDFVIGHADKTFYPGSEMDDSSSLKKVVLKESVVNKVFSGDDLFNLLLNRIGLLQLNIPFVSFEGVDFVANDVVPSYVNEAWHEEFGEEVFFSLDGSLIIYPDKVLVSSNLKDKVESIISCFFDTFSNFIEEYKSASSIDHVLYIDWLVKWFPGMIHFRSIEHK